MYPTMSETHVTIVGNLTRIELKFTPSGLAVAEFGLAVNKRVKNDQGGWEDGEPQYYDCTAWRELAENITESCQVGTRMVVSGQLNFRKWQANDGTNRSKVSITVDAAGPDLRWVTAVVTKNERAEYNESAAPKQQTPKYENEEPFVVSAADWEPGVYGSYPERMLP